MFTGIVSHSAFLQSCTSVPSGGVRLLVATDITDPVLGESIAIDGVCLTVTGHGPKPGVLAFDVSPETLALTLLGQCQPGQRLHVERALRVGDRLGGHWVTGHVDGCVVLAQRDHVGEYLALSFSGVPAAYQRYCVKKGSVALAGISLTINEITNGGFTVMCIPHTQVVTQCDQWQVGQRCHIEYDYLLKGMAARVRQEEAVV